MTSSVNLKKKEAGLGRKSGSYKFEKRQKELKKIKKKQEKLERRQDKGDDFDDENQPEGTEEPGNTDPAE